MIYNRYCAFRFKKTQRKVVRFLRLLKKGKDGFGEKGFEKEWNKCKIPGVRSIKKQWKTECVLDIITNNYRLNLRLHCVPKKLFLVRIMHIGILLQVAGCILKCLIVN